MSKRLDSLNTKKPESGSKPSLRFKPKIVSRKSKEERQNAGLIKQEADNKTLKENKSTSTSRTNSNRQGNRPRQKNYADTHIVSSGHFGPESNSFDNKNLIKKEINHDDVRGERRQRTEVKREQLEGDFVNILDGGVSENGLIEIDMSKDYNLDSVDSRFLPVRAERRDEKSTEGQYNSSSKEAMKDLSSKEPSKEPSIGPSGEKTIEEKLQEIKEHKSALETKITETVDVAEKEESNKLAHDQEVIPELLNRHLSDLNLESKEGQQFFLFQLPVLPHYESKSMKIDPESETSRSNLASKARNVYGQIGRLNIHKSGKLSIHLGNDIFLDICQGSPVNFLQSISLLEIDPDRKKETTEVRNNIFNMGQTNEKIIARPSIR